MAKAVHRQGVDDRVRVYCRIRPNAERPEDPSLDDVPTTFVTSTNSHSSSNTTLIVETEKTLIFRKDDGESKTMTFDSVLDPSISQLEVYQQCAESIVEDVLEGYNGTIVAYGQTSTGKTYTMMGSDDGTSKGIIPRSLDTIFEKFNSQMTMFISFVQIYCERITDLLNPETPPSTLSIRENAEKGVFIKGVARILVTNVEEAMAYIRLGISNRATASTYMNDNSSRSHAICIVTIDKEHLTVKDSTTQKKVGTLFLVDLAGSERVDKSFVRGSHFSELKAINLSLSALGNCVAALSQKRPHVPYRDSKLTRLLQGSLGGNSKTSLIITATFLESESNETYSTLMFGQRAMNIEVKAFLNIQPDYKALYEALQSRVDTQDDQVNALQIQLQQQSDKNANLIEQMERMTVEIKQKHLELEALQLQLASNNWVPQVIESGKFQSKDLKEIYEELYKKMEEELATLRMNQSHEIENLLKRHNDQVTTYKTASHQASQEWHNVENELCSERNAHLQSLQDLRECREKLVAADTQWEIRIAEMTAELIEKKNTIEQMEKRELSTASLTTQVSILQEKLDQERSEKSSINIKLKEDYVSREEVLNMESLYADSMEKLRARVDLLENSSLANRKPPLKNSQNRAVPRIGRVEPARKPTTRSS